jgi:repressor LexA
VDLVKDLTKRQKEIFDFIGTYLSKHGYPPTVREIGKAVGLHSSSTVHAHLSKLESLGVLKRDPSKPRALEVMVQRAKKAVRPTGLPLVGRSPPARRSLPRRTSRTTSRFLTWSAGGRGLSSRVRGEKHEGRGILEGDFVVVRPTERARDGEIVVALIADEATVKRFFREKDQVRLQPENKSMKPIRTRDVRLLGRVVGVFRRVS